MGGDGGTQCVRRDLVVKTAKRAVKEDPRLLLDAKWKHCQLTSNPLREPIVACELGRLYNRESILEYKLSKDEQPEEKRKLMSHIRGLKDVCQLKLSRTPGFQRNEGEHYTDRGRAQWCCPILPDIEMNGHHSFILNWNCGHVISENAIKEAPSNSCMLCDGPTDRLVVLNPNVAVEAEQRVRMLDTRKAAKLAKAAAKGKKHKASSSAEGDNRNNIDGDNGEDGSNKKDRASKKQKLEGGDGPVRLRQKPTINITANSALKAVQVLPKTVKDDDRASKTLKSLFTSSLKDPKKNVQNASAGSYTSRTTYTLF